MFRSFFSYQPIIPHSVVYVIVALCNALSFRICLPKDSVFHVVHSVLFFVLSVSFGV